MRLPDSLRFVTRLRKVPTLRQQIRFQHEEPHKWYFQGPDFVPFPPTSFTPPRSLSSRLLRSILWASLFCVTGAAATNTFTTWTWLHTLFQPGEEADTMYTDLIHDRFSDATLTKLMEAEGSGWESRSDLQPDGLDNCLRGSRGVSVKSYMNPRKASMIFLVHFGEGCEGWPGVVHGGCISAYVQNAIECFASTCWLPPDDFDGTDEAYRQLRDEGYYRTTKFEMSFENPVSSGDLYVIYVVPTYALHLSIMYSPKLDRVHMPKIRKQDYTRIMMASLMQMEYFPYEPRNGRRFVRYGNAVATFGNIGVDRAAIPVKLRTENQKDS